MGSSAQDGENEQYLSDFFFFWSFTVAKRFDFLKFRQLLVGEISAKLEANRIQRRLNH